MTDYELNDAEYRKIKETAERHKEVLEMLAGNGLKPCPFCNRSVHVECSSVALSPGAFRVHIIHDGMEERRQALADGDLDVDICIIESAGWYATWYDSKEEAIKAAEDAWNKRVSE